MGTFEQQLGNLSPEQRRLVELWLRREQAAADELPPDSSIPRRQELASAPLSFIQQRLWFLHQLEPSSAAYNLRTVVRLSGQLESALLERSLNQLICRHETLRTTFEQGSPEQDGQPRQVIAPSATIALRLVALDDLPPAEQEAQIQQLTRAETERPFDLQRGPLLRACLLRLAPAEHVLVLTIHHIISDGWSQGVQLRELMAIYAGLVQGKPAALPELPIQYADYALWQQSLPPAWFAEQLAYWKQQLGPSAHVLELPTDRPRPTIASYRGAWDYCLIPAEVLEQLKALSRREGVTLFMTLLAAFDVLLYRYTGQRDLVVGTPVAGRNRQELEGLIGMFVNMLPLRVDLSGGPTFRELLQRVRGVTLGAYAHQELPFEKLVEELHLQRDLSRNAVFQVMLALQTTPLPPLHGAGLTLTPMEVSATTATLDLSLYIREAGQELQIRAEYATDLFDDPTIRRMLGHFHTLLAAIAADAERRLDDLPLLSEAERHQLLQTWNATRVDYPQHESLAELFAAQATATPDAIALVCGDERLSYGALNQQANQLAHYLRARSAGQPETLIGVCMERSAAMVVAVLGILKAGAAYLPLDPNYPAERIRFMLADTQVQIILTQAELRAQLAALAAPESRAAQPTLICLDHDWPTIAHSPSDNPISAVSPQQLAYVVYTSGSTGRPKGVLGLHGGILNRLRWMWQVYPFDRAEVGSFKTSLNFVDSVWELFGTLLRGIPLVVIPDAVVKDLQLLVETLASTDVTRIVLPPALLQALLETYSDLAQRLPRLRYWTNSGEALSVELARRFFERLPQATLLNLYGSSEVAADALWYELTPHEPLTTVPIGRPLANIAVYVLDHALNPVPIGVHGEVYVGGAALARGYLGRPALTAEKFVPDPFAQGAPGQPGLRLYRTGDLARYRPDGAIEYLGRIDHQIKLRGFRIELGEIEATLLEHPAVRTAVVMVREDPATSDKRLVAYVVGEPRTGALGANQEPGSSTDDSRFSVLGSSSELRAFLREKLPEYMVPSAFVLLDALPLTPNGKVDRRALPEPEQMRLPSRERARPRTALQQALAELWASQLGLPRVGLHDSFFDLGGHSLKAAQLIARIRSAFQVDLPVRSLFQATTVADMAQLILAHEGRPGEAEQIAATLRRTRTSPAEQDLVTGEVPFTQFWFFEKNFPEPNRWNVATLLEVRQRLDPALVRQVVQRLVEHHDALRMRYEQQPAGWRSYIVAPEQDVPFSAFDLAGLSPEQQRAAIEARAGELQGSLNIWDGPLLRVALFDLGADQPCRLLMIVHHLAADVASLNILLEDFATAYQQLEHGAPIALPPKTTSFKAWAERLLAYAQEPATRDELRYWRDLPWHSVAPLPVDHPAARSANTDISADWVNLQLDRATTQVLLHEVLPRYDAEISELLLTALALTCTPWTGTPALLVEIVTHGRTIVDDVDLSRTVGWMAAGTIALLSPGAATTPGAALQTIKAYLRQIPESYGPLRYLCQNAEVVRQMRALPTPDILFNYLGQFDHVFSDTAPFQRAAESAGRTHNEQGVRERLLDVLCGVTDGQLQTGWRYSQNIHRRTTIERLAESFIAALHLLARPDQPLHVAALTSHSGSADDADPR